MSKTCSSTAGSHYDSDARRVKSARLDQSCGGELENTLFIIVVRLVVQESLG